MHEMWPIATDDHSVCQSVCHPPLDGFAVQKWLNRPRSCLEWRLLGRKEYCISHTKGRGVEGKFNLLYNTGTPGWITILLALEILGDSNHIALDRGPDPPWQGEGILSAAIAKLLWPLVNRCSAVFLVTYITLVCCEGVRRRWPGNFICLAIFVSTSLSLHSALYS